MLMTLFDCTCNTPIRGLLAEKCIGASGVGRWLVKHSESLGLCHLPTKTAFLCPFRCGLSSSVKAWAHRSSRFMFTRE